MATTQPVLKGNTLPHPSDYSEPIGYRGAFAEMADGAVFFDAVDSATKRRFILKYQNISSTDRSTIITAFVAIKDSYTSNNFTAPTGTTYTVTRDDSQLEIDWSAVVSNGALRWSGELRLREV